MAGTPGNLAPEIQQHLDKTSVPGGYKGEAVDVFNAGIVLFNLLFASNPFYAATPDDFYYQHIVRNEDAQFWNK